MLPVYHLWLGYMSELLQLPLLIPSSSLAPIATPSSSSLQTASIYPPFPPRQPSNSSLLANDPPLNVPTLHTKLTKAEFVGCSLRGELSCQSHRRRLSNLLDATVKRAKNPALFGLQGIVLQETQGTFKIVTPKSKVKGALIALQHDPHKPRMTYSTPPMILS